MRIPYIMIILLFVFYSAHTAEVSPGRMSDDQRAYRQGYRDGVVAGKQHGQGLWSTLGCAAGLGGSIGGCYSCGISTSCWNGEPPCFFDNFSDENVPYFVAASGCIGGIITSGILYAFAGNTGDTPAMLIGEKPHYARGYIDGYQYITKKKKRKAILTGAVVGTALGTLWLYGISQPVYAW